MALCLSVFSNPTANAEEVSFPCGDGATYKVFLPAGIATDGRKCSGVLVVDSSVKVIDNSAFYGSSLSSVVIPSSVIAIGDSAFWNTPLTSVSLPGSLESIGGGAFFNNHKLTSIVFPESLKSIGNVAFQHTPLTSIALPNSLTTFPAFSDFSVTNSLEI